MSQSSTVLQVVPMGWPLQTLPHTLFSHVTVPTQAIEKKLLSGFAQSLGWLQLPLSRHIPSKVQYSFAPMQSLEDMQSPTMSLALQFIPHRPWVHSRSPMHAAMG